MYYELIVSDHGPLACVEVDHHCRKGVVEQRCSPHRGQEKEKGTRGVELDTLEEAVKPNAFPDCKAVNQI